jgi:hypothetical protein
MKSSAVTLLVLFLPVTTTSLKYHIFCITYWATQDYAPVLKGLKVMMIL